MKAYTLFHLFLLMLVAVAPIYAGDGNRLWLPQNDTIRTDITLPYHSATLDIAASELSQAWKGNPVTLILKKDKKAHPDSYSIKFGKGIVTLSSPTEYGLLYGSFHLLRLQQTYNIPAGPVEKSWEESPAFNLRILNHWDNLDGTVERGYAGHSLWQWDELPHTLSPRYAAYARANASIGINGTVLNNVNASPQILSDKYLPKVKALADIFRPYGIKVYLSINFASPIVLGHLSTADPLNPHVIRWWKQKIKDIYQMIPDFGGFLVKANSEGQPGPQDYGRTHADGANMLAQLLKPHKGIVMWRAFVYSPADADRAKQAYQEFQPLDGEFLPNVIIQIKNGPVDFQPREPYSPLFGAMPRTAQMAELQITQEYLGFSNHLAYLAPMWKEFFQFVPPSRLKAIAGVSNIGSDENWCGHPFAQANWYAFGRLAWNPDLSEQAIANEWLKQTCYATPNVPDTTHQALVQMMSDSREAVVNYMMPLGLHHLFAWGHHYGPEPWCDIPEARPDWMPSYYHKAGKDGIGFNRTATGSNAVAQYPDSLAQLYGNAQTCPDKFLLWFHHLPWTFLLKNGNTLWDELCRHYDWGVRQVRLFQQIWDEAAPYVLPALYRTVQNKLKIQVRDAVWWKDACLLYFQQYSGLPIPYDIEKPIHELEDLKKVQLPISNYECPDASLLNQMR